MEIIFIVIGILISACITKIFIYQERIRRLNDTPKKERRKVALKALVGEAKF